MRKFSSNEDCMNSSPTSSSFQYPVYPHQIDKNGEKNIWKFLRTNLFFDVVNNEIIFLLKDFIMDGYYSPSRQSIATSTVNYNNNVITNKANMNLISTELPNVIPVVRVVKRRNTANKKERRRTQSINSAYTYLRDHIPNVPSDTKLSKVSRHVPGTRLKMLSKLIYCPLIRLKRFVWQLHTSIISLTYSMATKEWLLATLRGLQLFFCLLMPNAKLSK